MKKVHYLVFCLLISVLYLACKKDIKEDKEPEVIVPSNFDMKEIEIIVPASSAFKPAGSKVFSFGTEQTVDASGKAKVAFQKGSSTIAYVFDNNKKLMLAGFITDSAKVISPASTAKVLLYLGYNIPLQPDTLSVYFLNNIDKLPGAKDWGKEFETLFLADPLTLSNKSFVAPLRARMALMIDQTPAIDIRSKVADIQVDANDIKSGLQVSDDGLSKFKITNNYRRRAYAFLYKMSYKDMTGSPHDIKNKIETSTKADKDMQVDPVSAINGFFSEIGKNIEGKGLESFSVTSGPFPLELEDNESEAIYKLRVVGPGNMGKPGLTDAEKSKLTRLEMETFLYDLIIPAVGMIVSAPDKPVNGVAPSVNRDLKADALLTLLKSMPDVLTEVSNGNYKEALKKLLLNVYNDGTGVLMKELFMIALDKESVTGGVSTFFNERFENLLFILSMTDAALGASDLIRITAHALSSSVMEEWEMKARSGQVKLLPERSVVVTFQQQKLTAEIKNLTQTAYYEWSTSGKYGKLTDTKGHTDQLSFSSPDKDVFYVSKVSDATLSDGDNLEYIYVTAFAGGVKVGTDTAVINVKKDKYEMKPSGVTVSGKDGSRHEVRMYLEKPDGSNNIAPNSTTDYKVIWTTAGKYGKLNAKDITGVKTVTLYDDNSVYYECLDKDTKEGTETINARVYSKAKSEPESAYKIFDEVIGTVKINNDPKKVFLQIPTTFLHGDTVKGPYTNTSGNIYYSYICQKATVAQVPEVKDAKSYSLRFYGQVKPTIGAYTNHSWTPENLSFSGPSSYVAPKYAGGVYTVLYSYGGRNGGTPGHANGTTGNPGYAEVIVTLK